MTNSKQKQKSGDNSNNIQIHTMQVGLSYSDVKEIAYDIFETNFLKLKDEAGMIATERAKDFCNDFMTALQKNETIPIDGVKDPGFQYSLFEAQKAYIKTGDKDTEAVLIDILIDRLNYKERSLRQIVLDESIGVISKLTLAQLDTLTIIFLLKHSQSAISSLRALKEYINTKLTHFIDHLSIEPSLYQHLVFTGCGSISIGSTNIEKIFQSNYRGLFFLGFDKEYFKSKFGDIEEFKDLIIPCINDNSKLQINALNKKTLEEECKKVNLNTTLKSKLEVLFDQYILSKEETENKLIELGGSIMKSLIEKWNTSSLKNMSLTSVGIAIAQANYRRKTGITLDLSVWIK